MKSFKDTVIDTETHSKLADALELSKDAIVGDDDSAKSMFEALDTLKG